VTTVTSLLGRGSLQGCATIPLGDRSVALTLMVTALATTSGKVNIGSLSKGSGIRYRQRR
jgi:hypothetical protein